MEENFIETILEPIRALPASIKFPIFLTLAQVIAEEFPKAEKEFEEERRAIIERFFEIVNRIYENEEG